MAGTFAEFISHPQAKKIYLVEVEAGIPLTSWNREDIGGTYFVIFGEKIINAVPVIQRVEEDGSALTQVSSVASCTAASATWYQEDAGETTWDTAGSDELTDGGLENWDDATHLTDWNERVAGGVNRNDTDERSGTFCCRFNIDGAWISQQFALLADTQYSLIFYYKTTGSSTIRLWLRDDTTNYYLHANNYWHTSATYVGSGLTSATYIAFTFDFTSDNAGNYTLFIQNSGAADNSYIDDISIIQKETLWDDNWTKWDEHGLLHVHTSDNTNANDKTIVAYIDLHFSNYPKIFSNNYYFPRLTKASVPSVSASTKDIFFGKTSVGKGSLVLNNGDGFFDIIHRRYTWKGNAVTVKLGGDYAGNELVYSEYTAQFTGIIQSNYYSDKDYRIDLRDIREDFYEQLPLNEALPGTYPNMDSSKYGNSIPLVWGDVHNITPILIDSTAQKGKYKIADDADKVGDTLYAIDAVYDDGVAIGAVDLSKDCAAGEFTILNTYAGTPGEITCDVQGRKDDALGTITGTANSIIDRAAYIIKDICLTLLGKASADLDTTSFNDTATNADYELAIYLDDKADSSEIIEKICNSVAGLRFVIGADGKIYLIYPTGTIPAGIPSIIDEDIIDLKTKGEAGEIYRKMIVRYDRDPTNDTWLSASQSDDSVKYKYKKANTREIESYLKQNADASTMALRWLNISKAIPDHIYITTGLKPSSLKVGGQIKLTRERAPVRTGKFVEDVYRVLAIKKDFRKAVTKLELTSDIDILGIDACDVACMIYCKQKCQTSCKTSCQDNCELNCQRFCQRNCRSTCQINSCQSGCENSCLSTCEQNCQAYCKSNCQTVCELACEAACEASCLDQCEQGCLDVCQQNCQAKCQKDCQTGAEVDCQTTCETAGCQTTCEAQGCQTECKLDCRVACEGLDCQTTCETDCLDACEMKCQNTDQEPTP